MQTVVGFGVLLPSVEELLEAFDAPERAEMAAVVEAMSIAARETFGPFNDEEDSLFYEADDLDPGITWERLAERVVDATGRAIALALCGTKLSQALVCDVHRHIFGDLFPEVGGRMRSPMEDVQYSILIGEAANRHRQTLVAMGGRRLPERMRNICDEFNKAVEAAFSKSDPDFRGDLVLPAVRAYAKLLAAHPFMDGNGRTCYVLLQFGLVRIGLLAIALDDFEEHQVALGAALRRDGKQSYLQLRDIVSDRILDARF